MIKGLLSSILGAVFVSMIILVILHFAGVILWLAGMLVAGVIIAAIVLFIILFIFAIVAFLALFYYVAEKKPEISPGEYTLKEEKGKNK